MNWFKRKKHIDALTLDNQNLRHLYASAHVRMRELEALNYSLRREVDKFHRELVNANRAVQRKSEAVRQLRADKEQILKEGSENWLKRMDNYRKQKRAERETPKVAKMVDNG